MSDDYKKEALPHDIEAYRREAQSMPMASFEQQRPYPFLLYARSKLWDPTLIMAAQSTGDETMMVDYNVGTGGMTFISPVKKMQTDPNDPRIELGRGTANDVVVPVSSVSTQHLHFLPPGVGPEMSWMILDLDSRNGTYLGEEKVRPKVPTKITDSQYLRLGGNLIAWFFYPGRVWQLLHDDAALKKHTDL